MPILDEQLERMLVPRILGPATTVAELLYFFAAQPEPANSFAVVRFAADAYDVIALDDLQEQSDTLGKALLPMELRDVPGLLRPGEPVVQSQIGEAQAEREKQDRHRRRLVVLDDDGNVIGLLVTHFRGLPVGASPLDLLSNEPLVLGGEEEAALPTAPPSLNTRFDGVGPNEALTVGRRIPLIISVGAPMASNAAQSSTTFAFDFAGKTEPIEFTVRVDADPGMWTIREDQTTMIVNPPGTTTQEAEFTVIAKQPGRDKLIISILRGDALVQKIWLPVVAAQAAATLQTTTFAIPRTEASLPLDSAGLRPPAVELTLQPGPESTFVVVHANLPSGEVHETYRIHVSGEAIQNATLRLRQELQKVVYYPDGPKGFGPFPFANKDSNTIDSNTARQVCVPLADAGWQVWDLIFNAPGGDNRLKQLTEEMRALPDGSRLRVVLESHEFIVPWNLLYDAPGPIDATTLDWSGFWGYRYQIEVFPTGRYPTPVIPDAPPGIVMLLNDDQKLSEFTQAQVQYVQQNLASATTDVVWGSANVRQALRTPPAATLIYCYCHGEHESGAVQNLKRDVTSLASESALIFSKGQPTRLVDLRQLPAGPLGGHPLVFLNACEGSSQDAFYYDGFMPFFIQQQGARGFIGAEVKAPQLLGHAFGLQFLQMFAEGEAVGEILWKLRRYYLKEHNNILAFNYSLYCPGETRLATPVLAKSVSA